MNENTMRAAGELIRYQASEVFADEEPHLQEVYITVRVNYHPPKGVWLVIKTTT